MTGDLVRLAPLVEADLALLFEWINQRDLQLGNGAFRPVSQSEHRSWYEALPQRRDQVVFAVRQHSDDSLLGSCQLVNIDPLARNAELRIRLGRLPGRGFGTEATRLLLDFAFGDLNLERVYLFVQEQNQAARRVYEKVGFEVEGRLRRHAFVDGQFRDILVMGVLRP
ncbi:MAG: GNAT family N-acetyltransferase [Candidatus Eremiobacteraeota bacterium]|nr:GNAT family N-acetyltransferase [Candidatus Eremiobacteraeota bacterium]